MSAPDQIRALMMRHNHLIKNREQCMLSRAATVVGMPAEAVRNQVQGEPHPTVRSLYDRSGAALS